MPISLRFPIALALSIVGLALPALADLLAGMDAHGRGDYAKALSELLPLAEQGNTLAQFSLGEINMRDYGVPQDYDQARQ